MVTKHPPRGLEDLARADPVVARLALLQAEALRACGDPAWAEDRTPLPVSLSPAGVPLLHRQTLHVDPGRLGTLLERLADVAVQAGVGVAQQLHRGLQNETLAPLPLLEASITRDLGRLRDLATPIGSEPELLLVFGQLAALPLLNACCTKATPLLNDAAWECGYCPICAAWPALAELRGLSRERWLRCGCCGAGWKFPHRQCTFCSNTNHRTQGYLAAEAEREMRRAETCDECRSYLKTVATLGRLAPVDLAIQDLTTLELDVAALEQGYSRARAPGFPLDLRLAPVPGRFWRSGRI